MEEPNYPVCKKEEICFPLNIMWFVSVSSFQETCAIYLSIINKNNYLMIVFVSC